MSDELSYQQNLVFDRLVDTWEKTLEYNDDLDKRTTLITGASSIVVGIVAAAKFLPEHANGFSVESVLLGVVCMGSVLMYWYAIDVWRASLKAMPGTTSVDVLFDQYIALSKDVAYNNALIDLTAALEKCVEENRRKSERVEKIVRVFQFQIAMLGTAIASSGIVALVSAVSAAG